MRQCKSIYIGKIVISNQVVLATQGVCETQLNNIYFVIAFNRIDWYMCNKATIHNVTKLSKST